MTLLIMLGVLFLLSLFKESTATKVNEVSIPKKIENSKRELSSHKEEE